MNTATGLRQGRARTFEPRGAFLRLLAPAVCVCFFFLYPAAGADWPQFQCNAARTGWTPDSPEPPLEFLYMLDFTPEILGLCQPIVFQSTMYIPTLHGRIYAFDPYTGGRRWVREGLEPIQKTLAAGNGLVYAATLGGKLLALRAGDGSTAWETDLGFGISACPCLYEGNIYLGTRRGEFFCVEAASGKVLWQKKLPAWIWASAAVADGRVYVPTDGEIRLCCLDAAAGSLLWQSEKLPGNFVRDWCPVVAGDKVFLRTMPLFFLGDDWPKPYAVWERDKSVFLKYHDALRKGELPEDFKQANEELVKMYAEKPWMQTMFAFDAKTGAQPYIVGAFHFLAGWGMCSPPPAMDSEGMLATVAPFPWCRFGRLDPKTGRICDILAGPLLEQPPHEGHWDGFGGNTDEAHAASCGGSRIYWAHYTGAHSPPNGFAQNCAFDLRTRAPNFFAPPRFWSADKVKPLPASVSTENRRRIFGYEYITDNTTSEGFAPPALWQDLLIQHCGSAIAGIHSRIVVMRGKGGAQ